MYTEIIDALKSYASEEKASVLRRFFKTGPGEYGEGDTFIGVTVPHTRQVANSFADARFDTIEKLLSHSVHEVRLCALLILVRKYTLARRDATQRKNITEFYLTHTGSIDNWDLVDLSAPKILGMWVRETGDTAILHRLSISENMWEQRIAIVATMPLIKNGDTSTTIALASRYLTHSHHLMHKATGWLLREAGKKDLCALLSFLDRHTPEMPRTALRYAIERLTPEQRHHYMAIPRRRF